MDGYLKLDKMLDWQVANYPLRNPKSNRILSGRGMQGLQNLWRWSNETIIKVFRTYADILFVCT